MTCLLRLLPLAFIITAGFCQGAVAQPNVPNDAPVARANAGTVGVIPGGIDGTYVGIAADLAAVLDDGQVLRVLPVLGKGSLQNLADILYLRVPVRDRRRASPRPCSDHRRLEAAAGGCGCQVVCSQARPRGGPSTFQGFSVSSLLESTASARLV